MLQCVYGGGVGWVSPLPAQKEYESRPSHRARAVVHRGLIDLSRMDPKELTEALIDDGLLPDLVGCPCPNVKCEQQTQGYGQQRVLGPLSEAQGVDKTQDSYLPKCNFQFIVLPRG
jgi:hypothetical protein